jgi:hypothetical protein
MVSLQKLIPKVWHWLTSFWKFVSAWSSSSSIWCQELHSDLALLHIQNLSSIEMCNNNGLSMPDLMQFLSAKLPPNHSNTGRLPWKKEAHTLSLYWQTRNWSSSQLSSLPLQILLLGRKKQKDKETKKHTPSLSTIDRSTRCEVMYLMLKQNHQKIMLGVDSWRWFEILPLQTIQYKCPEQCILTELKQKIE